MFKDIKSEKLRKYFMGSVSQVQGLSFTFLCNLVLFVCKQTDKEDKLMFLFEIFTKQQEIMKKSAMKDFIEIFALKPDVFGV